MPIFSAVANMPFVKQTLFPPSTESGAAPPAYAFFFEEPQNFKQTFTFDNGVQFNHPSYEVVCKGLDFDLNKHSLHYRRLFKLTYLSKSNPKYYLIPWLAVPFLEKTPDNFASVIPSFPLQVTAISIYENRVDRRVKKKINDANIASPRTLTLVPSDSTLIYAVWNKFTSPTINEIDCLQPQDITITIKDSDGRYPYQEHVDIEDNLGTKLGRLRLLFLERIEHKLILMNSVKKSNNVLQISMLDKTSTPPHDYITDLNSLFKKTGVEHIWVDDTLTIKYQDGTTRPFGLNDPIDLVADPPVDFSKSHRREHHIVNLIHEKLVSNIVGAGNYLFVCSAEWAYAKGPIAGISNTKGRTCCIFEYSRHNLCHEAAHGLGLPHYFFEDADSLPPATPSGAQDSVDKLALEAKTFLVGFSLATQGRFEKLHDDMNANNACDELEAAFKAVSHRSSEIVNVNRMFFFIDVDRFVAYNTRNLMDYFKPPTEPGATPVFYLKEKLVKHQIEFLRFFITNKLFQ